MRVGYAIGRRQFARSRYISGVALVVGWLLSVGTVLFMAFGRFDLVGAYTSDVDVAKLAVVLMLFSATYQVVDFTQTIASYALRGYKLTRVPMCIHAVAFWLLGLLPGACVGISVWYGHLWLLDGVDCVANGGCGGVGLVFGEE